MIFPMKRLIPFFPWLLGALWLSACAPSAGRGPSWPGLTADSERAYLADGQFIYAVRLRDGAKVWQYPEKGGAATFSSNPLLTADGQLLAGSAGNDHALYSLDAATGKERWPAPFAGAADRWMATPLVVDNLIYAPNNDGTLYVLDLSNGKLIWSLPISHSLWATPVTNGKWLFVASLDHFLYAVDPQARKIIWKTDLGGALPASPALSADGATLYAGAFTRQMYAVNAENGTIRWTAATHDWVWATPTLDGGIVYAADLSGYIYALDELDGKNRWPQIQPDGAITASLLVRGENILAATEAGTLIAFNRAGEKAWEVNVGGKIYASIVDAGEQIIVSPLNADFLLAALNPQGQILWKFTGK